jgi:hypothetical protein
MSLKSLALLAGGLICTAAVIRAEDPWLKMKAGMNLVDTLAAVGEPLFKNTSRGFELWIYDSGAEVVCYRSTVVAWTAPVGHGNGEGRQLDLRFFFKTSPAHTPAQILSAEPDPSLDLAPLRTMRLPRL